MFGPQTFLSGDASLRLVQLGRKSSPGPTAIAPGPWSWGRGPGKGGRVSGLWGRDRVGLVLDVSIFFWSLLPSSLDKHVLNAQPIATDQLAQRRPGQVGWEVLAHQGPRSQRDGDWSQMQPALGGCRGGISGASGPRGCYQPVGWEGALWTTRDPALCLLGWPGFCPCPSEPSAHCLSFKAGGGGPPSWAPWLSLCQGHRAG